MRFINRITETDALRADTVDVTPAMLTSAHLAVIEAAGVFAQQYVNPVAKTLVARGSRENALLGLYYRLFANCLSAVKLAEPIHFQALSSVARSAIELFVDMRLIHENKFADGPARFDAFTDAQKLRAARGTIRFYQEYPHLDETPSKAAPHHEYVKNRDSGIEATCAALWGKKPSGVARIPDHWTDRNLKDRAKLLDDAALLLVHQNYYLRNFQIHSGVAGIIGMPPSAFTSMCLLAYNALSDCILEAFRILDREFQLGRAIPGFDDLLADLAEVSVWALTDLRLRSLGDPPRYELDPST